MKSETYKNFISRRSHSIGVFNGATNEPLWVFESKQRCTTLMGIHHSTLMKCVRTGSLYLNCFKFKTISSNSLTLHPETEVGVFLDLVKQKRSQLQSHKYRNKKAQKIYAQHKTNPLLSQVFESQRDCAKFFKADRGTLRRFLKNTEPFVGEKYFRKVWKFHIV